MFILHPTKYFGDIFILTSYLFFISVLYEAKFQLADHIDHGDEEIRQKYEAKLKSLNRSEEYKKGTFMFLKGTIYLVSI